jgi:DNA-binding LacI/PurR family transcriptional regulator
LIAMVTSSRSPSVRAAVRLADVAARAGVSRSVAGHVLHAAGGRNTRVGEATAARVVVVAEELGYRPNRAAQQLNGVRSKLLGALIAAESAQVHFDRLLAIERVLRTHGFRLIVGHVDDAAALSAYLDDFEDRGVEGLILVDQLPGEWTRPLARRLREQPVVLCAGRPAFRNAYAVNVDRAAGVRQAVDHLAARKRTEVGLVLENPVGARPPARLRGFRSACEALGIEPRVWAADLDRPVFDPDVIAAYAQDLVDTWVIPQRLNAVVAPDDLWAVRIVKALGQRRRRVPRDVAVVGFDNVPIARACTPELTTVDQDNPRLAELGASLLLEALGGTDGATASRRRQVVVQPHLVVREST